MEQINLNQTPNEKQRQFLECKAKYVAFGGARGGGKSWAVRMKAKLLCFNYDGIKVLIIRSTYPELEENHIKILRLELANVCKYNDKNKRLTFPNGSTITFGYCSNDKDLTRYQGTEWDVIFFDEATNLTEYQMLTIAATNRGVNNFPKRIYYTCNPGGQGHGYIKRLFIDRAFKDGENPDDYVFIQSLVYDNKILLENNPDYIKMLEALPPEKRKAWLYGQWDVFEGQFFEEFRNDPNHYKDRIGTHVIEPFEIKTGWKIYRSFDWGYNKPFSCDWWAIDYDGRAYLILQYYGCTGQPNQGLKMNPHEVFKEIHRIETSHRWLKGKYIEGVADPAIWGTDTGESIAEIAEKYQVYFSPADHSRLNGWMQCHYRLAFDEQNKPMVYFFNTCRHAIRTLPLLMYSPTKMEDLDTTQEDHFADSFRYFCMARPIKPTYPVDEQPELIADPLNQFYETNRNRYARY